MKYTIRVSPDYLRDLPQIAVMQSSIDGDKFKAYVSVSDETGRTINVPITVKQDNVGYLSIDFES